MIPPSNNELTQGNASKYAIVVAIAKQARLLSESNKDDENYRLSSMVSEALSDLITGKLEVCHQGDVPLTVIDETDVETPEEGIE